MDKEIIPGKTLYDSPEDALNAIVDSINELDKKIETLTMNYNEMLISNASNLVALFNVLKLSEDEILDFYNFSKKEQLRTIKQVNSTPIL